MLFEHKTTEVALTAGGVTKTIRANSDKRYGIVLLGFRLTGDQSDGTVSFQDGSAAAISGPHNWSAENPRAEMALRRQVTWAKDLVVVSTGTGKATMLVDTALGAVANATV